MYNNSKVKFKMKDILGKFEDANGNTAYVCTKLELSKNTQAA